MYKQYRFQYTAPPKTTSPAKTPVEVTADDVINAVKDWVAYDNVRVNEYHEYQNNMEDTTKNTGEEWTLVEAINKNVKKSEENQRTTQKNNIDNMLNKYFFEQQNDTNSIVNVLNTILTTTSEQKEGIDSAIFICDFLNTKNVDIDPSKAVYTEPLQTFIQETKEKYVNEIINLEDDNFFKKNLKSVFIPKTTAEQTTAIKAITRTLSNNNNEETAKYIRNILTIDMVNVRRAINICLNEIIKKKEKLDAIKLEQEKQNRRVKPNYNALYGPMPPPRRPRGPGRR